MIYITGDTHGDFSRIERFCEKFQPSRDDIMIILGDAGFNYQGTTLMNNHMNGEFPVLKPGVNAISWTGTVTKVVFKPNWRYL